MEGRILRRQADPQAQPQTAGPGGRAITIRMVFGTAVAVITAALLVSALALVTTSVAKIDVATAKASNPCAWAKRGPRRVSQKHARKAVVCEINKKRRGHGLRRVRAKSALRKAGKRHSKYMKRHGCFAHQCPGEKDLVGRIHDTSYLPCNCSWRVGETLGWGEKGHGTPRAIVKAWMNSPAHRHVLLDRGLKNVGVGVVWGSPSGGGSRAATYTADFGYRRG